MNIEETKRKSKKNVLILNCGTLAATDINMALRYNEEFEVYGSSSNSNHGEFVYKNYISDIPNMDEPSFFNKLNENIEKYNISFIIPAHDSLTLFCQENKDKINAVICCSPYETALLCRYKSKTYEYLKDCWFTPKVYNIEEEINYPVFIKKDDDQGARNAFLIRNSEELAKKYNDSMIICEYLPGEEVTIDCFSNKNRELLYCNPRVADRMLAGIDVRARRLKNNNEILEIAKELNSKINFRGCWFFQVKKDKNGKFKLLEISTRLPGAFSLSRGMDVNLPLLALKDFDNQDVIVDYNDYQIETDKQFFTKYRLHFTYESVYIDYNSLIIDNKINQTLMMYIYQCYNLNKNIILVSEKNDDLNKYPINRNLFNNIITKIELFEINEQNKNVYISNNQQERIEMRKNNFYCFSPSSIEALIEWKG